MDSGHIKSDAVGTASRAEPLLCSVSVRSRNAVTLPGPKRFTDALDNSYTRIVAINLN